MRHALPASLLIVLAACSQAAQSTPETIAASTPTPSAASSWDESMAAPVPREPFTDPQKNFDEVRKSLLAGYYRDSLTEADLYRAAAAGMLERADPTMHKWNKLLSPADMAELRSDLQGELVGVGVKIAFDPATGYIDVQGTVPGSPAERAGVAPPDKIVTVDGKLYKGLTLHDVVGDIRGKPGETVTLSILRGAQLVSIPVVREKLVYDSVHGMILAGDVGYVHIPGFNARTPDGLRATLTDLASHHPRALIVDVRSNPGGSFDDAVAAAGELVPAGSTVVTVTKRDKVEPVVAKTTPVLQGLPMAVLVSHETASSAELLTATLRDLEHATVVGMTTQGKWTVQTLEDLPNGYAMKYTVGVFASPSGKSYEGVGMTPDVEVDWTEEAIQAAEGVLDPGKRVADDVQLRTAIAVLARSK